LDLKLLSDIAKYFASIRKKYNVFECGISGVDTDVLTFQIPGGMLSNLVSQLREQNALDKYEDVLKEVPVVRKELGYPPLVTPTSQIVGTQAVFNVISGDRYKVVPKEVRDYVMGMYGRTAAPIDENVRKKIIGDEKPYEGRPADLLKPELPAAYEAIKEYSDREEDAISYVLFPQPTLTFLKNKKAGFPNACEVDEKINAACNANRGLNGKEVAVSAKDGGAFQIVTNGKAYDVEIANVGSSDKALLVVVDGREYNVFLDVETAGEPPKKATPGAGKGKKGRGITGKSVITPPMPGRIVDVKVKEGDTVKSGDLLLVLEAMKMQNEIRAQADGVVKSILVSSGDSVELDDVLIVID
jgi:pyruvate carboxylase subunit B